MGKERFTFRLIEPEGYMPGEAPLDKCFLEISISSLHTVFIPLLDKQGEGCENAIDSALEVDTAGER